MAQVSACPDEATLKRLVLGLLPPPVMDQLGQHLEGCRRCVSTLSSCGGTDQLVEALHRAAKTHPDHAAIDKAAADKLVQRVLGAKAGADDSVEVADASQDRRASALAALEPGLLKPPQAADEIGRLGPYRVLKELGAGGMGMVFVAEDPQLRRLVALKVLKKAQDLQRFLREARATAAVKNDHIVTIFQVGQEGDIPYLAMELLRGESLEHWLQRGRQAGIPQVVRLGREMASGLAAAHAAGLVHRDIKPANTFLEMPHGRVKILDFGLARLLEDKERLTRLGDILGTPAYMAPEQARGEKVDPRCDLFSLGCVLYRLCVGQVAFPGKDVAETLEMVMTRDPPAPRQIKPNVPPPLSDLVMQLLAKKKGDRPASAAAVVERLRAIQAQVAVRPAATTAAPRGPATHIQAAAVRPAETRAPAETPARNLTVRRPLRGVMAAVAVLAVCLLAWVIWHRAADKGPDPRQLESTRQVDNTLTALDRLDAATVPADLVLKGPLRIKGRPPELVGILLVDADARPPLANPPGALPGAKGFPGISALAFSRDGKLLAAGGAGGVVFLWDLSGDQPRITRRTRQLPAEISSLAFHPHKNMVAAGYVDSSFRFWDFSKEEAIEVFHGNAAALKPAEKPVPVWLKFSSSCDMMATHYGNSLKLWSLQDAGALVRSAISTTAVGIPDFSPDNRLLAWGAPGEVKFMDVTAKELTPQANFKWPADQFVHSVAYAPARDTEPPRATLACAADGDNLVRLVELTEEGPKQAAILHGLEAQADNAFLEFSKDGKWLAGAGSGGRLLVWNTATLKLEHDWLVPGPQRTVAFAPDSRHLASGADRGKVLIFRLQADGK
jgi:hypothetical protein